jgi:hypothetical protein
MPFYAFTNFNEDNATYTGFRMVEADWELGENETLVEADSLDGYTEAIIEAPQTPQEKLQILTAMVSELDDQKQADLLQGISGVYLALNAGNLNVAKLAVANIPTGNDPQLVAMKQAVLAILES